MAKVLFITGYFPFAQGGAEYQALLLADRLKERGTVAFIFRNHFGKPDRLRDRGFHLYAIRPCKVRKLNANFVLELGQVRNLLDTIAPDVIYVRGANAYGMAAARYARQTGCRLVWHIAHDNELIPARADKIAADPVRLIHKKIEAYGLRHADVVIAQTFRQADLLRRNLGIRCHGIIGNWHPIAPSPPPKPVDRIRVLWIANWKPIKQPEVFIRLAEALKSMPSVQFTMCGRNSQYPKLCQAAAEAGIDITGELPVDQVNTLLAESHLLVNTSLREGFSNTFIQAWMRRVPVISLHVDPDRILAAHKLGRCSGSFDKLVRDTRQLISDPRQRETMGDRARQYAITRHSLKNLDRMLPLFTHQR